MTGIPGTVVQPVGPKDEDDGPGGGAVDDEPVGGPWLTFFTVVVMPGEPPPPLEADPGTEAEEEVDVVGEAGVVRLLTYDVLKPSVATNEAVDGNAFPMIDSISVSGKP